jgi:hypothetical protein
MHTRMIAGAALAGAAALVATLAAAQQAPIWSQAPTVADVAAAYPAKARAAGVGGMVNLTCTINYEARPSQCYALGESPEGYGFAFAAKTLAEKMRGPDASLNGQEIRIPFVFDPKVANGAAVVTRPVWAALPSAADFQASFPQTANGVVDVRVVLSCTVGPDGALGGCAVDREDPPGQGYGQGALAVASKFRVGPWSQDNQPTIGAQLHLPIHYVLTPVQPPPKS